MIHEPAKARTPTAMKLLTNLRCMQSKRAPIQPQERTRFQIVDAPGLQREHLDVGGRGCLQVVLGIFSDEIEIHDLGAQAFKLKWLKPSPLLLQNVLNKVHGGQLGGIHRICCSVFKRQLRQFHHISADVLEATRCPTVSFVFQKLVGRTRDNKAAPTVRPRT